ncbi:MAG: hypothetical protein AAF604_05600 [Acidobacteriota bacterium]
MTLPFLLFGIVFLGQIFFISWYFPGKIFDRVHHIRDTYPPQDYPKLYPNSAEYYKLGAWLLRATFRAVFILGFVVLAAVYFLDPRDDGSVSEAWPAAYGALQFLPLMLLEIVSFTQFRQMRQSRAAHRRKASLQPRRLFDFVPPWLLALAVLAIVGQLAFDYWVHEFVWRWHQTAILLGTNLFLAGFGVWQLYGKKLDPHQATADRIRQSRAQLRSLVFVSIAMSLFFITTSADQVYDIDYLDAPLLSLYFQAITFLSVGYLLQSQPLENIDFEVYRAEPDTSTA